MSSIADSDAFYDKERQLTQHQAVLTLIQQSLSNPHLTSFRWLDLACGKGQIIANIDENFNGDLREKIEYYGYDIENDYLKFVEKMTRSFNLKCVKTETGKLSNFHKIYNKEEKFDLITLTNTIHEIDPKIISLLLFESLYRLSQDGFIFIYDMEKLPQQELGAITWTKEEFEEIVRYFLNNLGTSYSPPASRWKHSSCMGWNITLYLKHLAINLSEIEARKADILSKTNQKIIEIINRKQDLCKVALETLTIYGSEVREEEKEKIEKLYEFWALSRAKGSM
ncbi:hypothetical protein EO98_09355 [Methanosarcina sp. 2.H.T.1A.6]|uniref:class I SAM-dependent methyltransferase n=1 Tax=unclassified Methanosarcina TaxID=2644672 RepID=UPI0006221C00|nr:MULTISPECIES: class I SAM-dependent methyltransferase [unclassified Methanosarcina]KKG14168.1 hypothetical protein EO94_15745 [Methanosarcina sp. 2.H.T.1A.3]KKG15338.1 hypothetical protein EO97_04570 [Methanosarcina sp. 2.H.T.1A.15]KKG19658.1 hypothetical protein EO98_09355 [Methanosarcina sp. 2.H.T.1A.6]KKG24085.1 hypothetical protein EO96_11075 [Methanosarcina sp. 2.H.T.1A.8]